MKSIRFYLIISLLSVVTLGNFVAAVHGYRSSMREAQALLDTQLTDTATLLQSVHPPEDALAAQPSERLAFQIWTDGGELVLRSANSGEPPMTPFEPGYRDANFEGHRWRVLTRLDSAKGHWIQVAERIDIRIELTDRIVLKSVMPIVLGLPLIGVIVWLVVGNGLSLVRKLANELRARRVDDLSRLHATNPPVELAPVVDAVNDLLQRLDDSVSRERRFSSDAAHELRTPLAAINVHVHNLKKGHPEIAAELEVLDRDLGRLGHLIEQILMLYRTTPEHYHARMRQLDLYALARSVVGELYSEIDDRYQNIELLGTSQTITADEDSLKIMLNNLISNASKYSPADATIQVSVEREAGDVQLAVIDSGPGLPDEELERVFDRFYRSGGDRHASSADGCGLGLSIARHIAELHGAKIRLTNNKGRPGLTARVIFASEAAAAAADWQ